MQTVSFKIWTQVTKKTSYNDNRYSTSASIEMKWNEITTSLNV